MKRLKLHLLTLCLLLTAGATNAQVMVLPRSLDEIDSLDNVRYQVMYELKFKPDVNDQGYVVLDEVRLDIGTRYAKEYSYRLYQADKAGQEALKTGKFAMPLTDIVPPWILYKNYPEEGSLTVDYRLPVKAPVKTYNEALPELQWQIKSDTKKIASYTCQRADVSFGGREWTAWFTPEIPSSYGPYKLGGLPGLIVELFDANDEYHYSLISFTSATDNPILGRWQWGQEPIERKDLEKIIRQLYANPAQMMKALGAPMFTAGDPMLNLPYNPIER